MNQQHLNEIKAFSHWAKSELKASSTFDINYWTHSYSEEDTVEYRIWVSDTLNKKYDSLEDLVNELPRLKEYCLMKKEFSL